MMATLIHQLSFPANVTVCCAEMFSADDVKFLTSKIPVFKQIIVLKVFNKTETLAKQTEFNVFPASIVFVNCAV